MRSFILTAIHTAALTTAAISMPSFTLADTTAADRFIALAQHANPGRFEAFKKACSGTDQPDFDGRTDAAEAMKKVAKSGNILGIRGMLYALQHCSDGASAEGLEEQLGDVILTRHTAKMLEALKAENFELELRKLAYQVGDERLKDCGDDACKKDLDSYYGRKRKAIQAAKLGPALEPLRARLLAVMPEKQAP